ncbi:MAG: hypothetical protein IBX57_01070 [Gammaproteobacteria bacterium]|nr:hypothetical protein [Gammaproteobacteria bacterium]
MSDALKKVLVDLDSILDTRISVLAKMNSDVASEFVSGDDYFNRDSDNFEKLAEGRVKLDDFKDQYSKRDKEILAYSRPTDVLAILNEMALEIEKQKLETPDVEGFVLYVNYFPYSLTEDEKEMFITSIMTYVGIESEVRMISLPTKDLKPSYIKENYDGVVMYNLDEWLVLHSKELNKVLLPRVAFFCPALLIKEPESLEDLKIEGLEGLSPFVALEMLMVERINLNFLKPKQFSIMTV